MDVRFGCWNLKAKYLRGFVRIHLTKSMSRYRDMVIFICVQISANRKLVFELFGQIEREKKSPLESLLQLRYIQD